MKIKTVTYSRLKTTAQYENERVEATAEVGAREDATEALSQVRAFVMNELGLGPTKSEYKAAKAIVDTYKELKR